MEENKIVKITYDAKVTVAAGNQYAVHMSCSIRCSDWATLGLLDARVCGEEINVSWGSHKGETAEGVLRVCARLMFSPETDIMALIEKTVADELAGFETAFNGLKQRLQKAEGYKFSGRYSFSF
ncbi:MAG TPA: hypothetical protein VI522_08425 [Gammaproteobacteria bacterium]|nr:hypothetical protein [Gammaproteobacteria bacterium]